MNRIRISGLWYSKKIKNGLSGKIWEGSFISIKPNTHKVKESDPDFVAYLETKPKNQDNQLGLSFE